VSLGGLSLLSTFGLVVVGQDPPLRDGPFDEPLVFLGLSGYLCLVLQTEGEKLLIGFRCVVHGELLWEVFALSLFTHKRQYNKKEKK